MKFKKEIHRGSTVYVPECKRCGAERATNQIKCYDKTKFDTYILLTVCDKCYKEIKNFIFSGNKMNEFVNNMLYDIEVTKMNMDTAIQEFDVAINQYYAYINSLKGR